MSASVDLNIDVADAAGIGEAAHVAVSVLLPDPERVSDPPVVCFALPGVAVTRRDAVTCAR